MASGTNYHWSMPIIPPGRTYIYNLADGMYECSNTGFNMQVGKIRNNSDTGKYRSGACLFFIMCIIHQYIWFMTHNLLLVATKVNI